MPDIDKKQVVCPGCGMSTWDENFGCILPGCENYGVIAARKESNGNN